MQKFKVNSQSVQKIKWKQMDGQIDIEIDGWTDRHTEATALPVPDSVMQSVTDKYK